jgi:PleD family two-component response regulator
MAPCIVPSTTETHTVQPLAFVGAFFAYDWNPTLLLGAHHIQSAVTGGAEVVIRQVFVVDDDRVIASTTATIMHLTGYEVRCFVNPLEALEAARNVKPDLVIADVIMPQLSGIDLAVQLKKQFPTCKLLLLSGQADTGDLL